MESWGMARRVRYGTVQCMGLGLLAGAMESVHLASTLKLPLSGLQFVVLGGVDMGMMALVASLLGVVAGVVHLVGQDRDPAVMISWQIALCTFLLTGFFLWQGAWWTATDGAQPIGAAAMAAMPPGFAGVAFFNARFLVRRAQTVPPAVPWIGVAGFGGWVLVGIAALLAGSRDTGGDYALEGDDNLVLVTVDGLRRDQVGVYGGSGTPRLDDLARSGITFGDAVTPTPGSRAANATVLTGLHPLRHEVLGPGHRLGRAYRPLFEILEAEGWATGGFVSDPGTSATSGLDQGFLTFDDDLGGGITGSSRINVMGHLLHLIGIEGGARAASATVRRFLDWLDRHREAPFAAWVHLSDPHHDPGPASVQAVDQAVGEVLGALEQAGVAQRTLVIVVGTHGELLGAHGGQANATLYDDVIRVPFLVRAPGAEVSVGRVDAQVRLMDVANTALEWLQLDRMEASEGLGLLEYATGKRTKTIWCPLVGRDVDGDWLIGLRNNGVKYIRHPDGREELYDLSEDPTELRDLSDDQPTIVERARSLLIGESVAFEKLVGG